MKRYRVLVFAGLVSACAASAVVGCGDDDTSNPEAPPVDEDGGRDASRTVPAQDAAGRDSQVPPPRDSGGDARPNEAGGPDAEAGVPDAEAGAPDADAGAPDADASAPDADAAPPDAGTPDADAAPPDAGPPWDAGPDPSVCHPGPPAPVTSIFPVGANVAPGILTVGYSECSPAQPVAANGGNNADGRYSPRVKTGDDGRLTVFGAPFRTTLTGFIDADTAFGPPLNAAIPLLAVGQGISPFDNAKAHVLVVINGNGACGAGGRTASVDGHAEGVVKYVNPAGADVGVATTSDGLVWISNLNPGGAAATVTISALGGCTRDNGLYNGQLALVANAVTTITVDLRP